MDKLSNKLLQATLEVVRNYNENLAFKQQFDANIDEPGAIYKGWPLKLYLKIITYFSIRYRNYYPQIIASEGQELVQNTENLLVGFYRDRNEFTLFEQKSLGAKTKLTEILPEQIATQVQETAKYREGSPEHKKNIAQLVVILNRPLPTEEQSLPRSAVQVVTKFKPPTIVLPSVKISLPKLQIPSVVKDLASQTQILARKIIVRVGPNLFSGALGAITGFGVAGPGGAVGGGILGSLVPNFIKSGGGGLLGRMIPTGGGGAGNFGGQVAQNLVKKAFFSNPWVWAGIGLGVLLLVLLPGGLNLLQTSSLLPPFEVAQTAPLPGGGGAGGDITNCLFTRGNQNPKEAAYQSKLLLGYFQEASRLSGVPAVLLAAITRVESPSIVNFTDQTLVNYGCPRSDTGALGLMQLQPPPWVDPKARQDAYFGPGIELGAGFLGKTAGQLTRADFCDIKSNIIISSGFIIQKTHALLGDGGSGWDTKWITDKLYVDKIAEGYYGCLPYGNPQQNCTGPYNYGDDLWTSIQQCKTTQMGPSGLALSCPIKENYGLLCGTYNYPALNGCGHGKPPYPECNTQTYATCDPVDENGYRTHTEFIKKAIDVVPKDLTTAGKVVLPYINGQVVDWVRIQDPVPITGGLHGYKVLYQTEFQGKKIILDLTHINSRLDNPMIILPSGAQIASLFQYTNTHLHVGLQIDGTPIEAEKEARMCERN